LSGAIRSVTKLASITFLSLALSYWIDYLGFITEGKLTAVLITVALGVPNWSVIYIINTAPSAPEAIRGCLQPFIDSNIFLLHHFFSCDFLLFFLYIFFRFSFLSSGQNVKARDFNWTCN
jgi:hypothetical protein